jgi:hypothetical protein
MTALRQQSIAVAARALLILKQASYLFFLPAAFANEGLCSPALLSNFNEKENFGSA